MASPVPSIPIIELSPFLSAPDSEEALAQCAALTKSLEETGIAILRDPRVPMEENEVFLSMLERYFDQGEEAKRADIRPELHFQVGATPGMTEVPRDHAAHAAALPETERPHPPSGADPKWRFFWRIGERPAETKFAELNAAQVVPAAFAGQWEATMDRWGALMLQAVTEAARMFAVGSGLPAETFAAMMDKGPHLLAPTGSDLQAHGSVGTVLAGFHTDLNFLTIHGKSRFPGLYVWLRSGHKMLVRVPDGCLLVQAGRQIEHLTAGVIRAGFHEVVVCEETLPAIERARAEGRPLWRVSSTLFSHIASDRSLAPLPAFLARDGASPEAYPDMPAGEQVQRELEAINLARK